MKVQTVIFSLDFSISKSLSPNFKQSARVIGGN